MTKPIPQVSPACLSSLACLLEGNPETAEATLPPLPSLATEMSLPANTHQITLQVAHHMSCLASSLISRNVGQSWLSKMNHRAGMHAYVDSIVVGSLGEL